MTSIYDVLQAFNPAIKEINERAEAGKSRNQDIRVALLRARIAQVQNAGGSASFDNFDVPNTHLSHHLTLADLRIALESAPQAADKIITYLNIQRNLDKCAASSPSIPGSSVTERIKQVSERVLEHVDLFDLQLAGFVIPVTSSSVWFALSSDQDFLNRQVRDLTKMDLHPNVIAARIDVIETQNPDLLNSFKDTPYKKAGLFKSLHLTIGKLRTLCESELNDLAHKLPSNAFRLLSDAQIRVIDLKRLKSDQLDEMIAGNGKSNEITRRLGLLSTEQLALFLKKSSGVHFSKFDDSFYQRLPLSTCTKEQVEALFDDHYGLKKEEATHRFQLVSPEEVSKGFHLLTGAHIGLLSDAQLAALDYSRMDKDQLDTLFARWRHQDEDLARRIPLIPARFVNDVVKVENDVIRYLSASQRAALDASLIQQESIHHLFPGFTIETLIPGAVHSIVDRGRYGTRHQFDYTRSGIMSCMNSYSDKELAEEFEKNKAQCIEIADRFTSAQLLVMKPSMHPECQELVDQICKTRSESTQ